MKDTNRIMIVEDEELFASKMEMQIELLGHELFAWVNNSNDALKLLEKEQPDLILMDVNIEGEYDGIELTDLIHQQWDIPVLFVTSFHDDRTFRRISRTNPVGYIIKPFSDAQLKHSISLVLKNQNENKEQRFEVAVPSTTESAKDFIFIKKRNQLDKVKISEIFYVEADGRYSQVYTISQKYLIRMSLKKLMERLQDHSSNFIQTHRSYIVNLKKVKTVDLENDVVVLENRQIPLSRREKENVLGRLDWM